MNNSKRILIICFRFPPFPGIGGRRWAKFAKYLKRKGHSVEVIAAQNPFELRSEWTGDIVGVPVHYLPLNYPEVLIKSPANFLEKIAYRLSIMWLKFNVKGNYHDTAVLWEQQLLHYAGNLIRKEGIKNVIVTAAPFMLAHYTVRLKDIFPDLNIVVDFRDLWTMDIANSSFSTLSLARQQEERNAELATLNKADVVTVVAEKMVVDFSSISNHPKYVIIPNGYDDDELKPPISSKNVLEKLNLVFTGSLYPNLEKVFFPFIDALVAFKAQSPELYNDFNIEFIGNIPNIYSSYVKDNKVDVVSIVPAISLTEVQDKIANASGCLLFLNDVYSFSLSTKFCEYIAQKKKIIVVSNHGQAVDFILKNRIGYWIDPAEPLTGINKVFEDFKNKKLFEWDPLLDVTSFSVDKITDSLLKVLI